MEDYKVARSVDAKGLSCPLPVMRAKKGIGEVAVGEVLEVLSTDPGSIPDFGAWTRATGHTLLKGERQGDVFVFHIQRTK